MASTPEFIKTARIGIGNTATANTAVNGTGTITPVIAGATGGTRVLEIVVKAQASTTACQVGIFLSLDSGATWTLFDQISVLGATDGTNTATARVSRFYANLTLASSAHQIGFTTKLAQSTSVIALGGDLA